MTPNERQCLVFAAFFERLATDGFNAGEWHSFVVQHYPDERLEAVRCQLVRLTLAQPEGQEWREWPIREAWQLRAWAGRLRSLMP
jgi:hypothetical protein